MTTTTPDQPRVTLHRDGTVSDALGTYVGRIDRRLVISEGVRRHCHVEWESFDAQGRLLGRYLKRTYALEDIERLVRWWRP